LQAGATRVAPAFLFCMDFKKYPNRQVRHSLSAPIIYSILLPVLVMDLWIEIYHRVCFPLYGLPYVKRSRYIRIDRHKLKKLSWLQKLNCMYCGYVNGFINYLREIGAQTEKYWCSIKHVADDDFVEPAHHIDFHERTLYE